MMDATGRAKSAHCGFCQEPKAAAAQEAQSRDAARLRTLLRLIERQSINTGGAVEAIVSGQPDRLLAILDAEESRNG